MEQRAMEVVAPGLAGHVNDPSSRPAKLGREGTAGSLEFLNGLDANRVDHCASSTGSGSLVANRIVLPKRHINSIQQKIGSKRRGAIEFDTSSLSNRASASD